MLPPNANVFSLDDDRSDAIALHVEHNARGTRGFESLQLLWKDALVPLARTSLPGVSAAIVEWQPDIVIADRQSLAGSLASRRANVTWATSCTTPVSRPEDDLFTQFPHVKAWLDAQLAELEREAGLASTATPDLSPDLVIVYSTPALAGSAEWPQSFRFVGPALGERNEAIDFPWRELQPQPRLFISLGTISATDGRAFYGTAVQALGDLPLQAIVAAPPSLVDAPNSWIVQERVPQLALLAQVDAVLTHGGHGTVGESLAFGLPLVVAPIRDDQPLVARQVEQAGAGIRVRFGHLSPNSLRHAITRILSEPQFRAAAQRIRDSFVVAGGAKAAADALEALAAKSSKATPDGVNDG